MTVKVLRELINVQKNTPSQACTLARAHLQNAFSMCNPDGTDARLIDFDRFQGSFTPEFYPRRFALKDSIYSQRLDVLASLLVYILRRYQCCLPPIRYCELSIGVGDICRPWVFDVLCSFPAHNPIATDDRGLSSTSTFRQMISNENRFPHLRSACSTVKPVSSCVPNVTYKFLAGFNRQAVKANRLMNQSEAIRLLSESPDKAIHYMLEEIAESEREQPRNRQKQSITTDNPTSNQPKRRSMFHKSLIELEKLKIATRIIKHFKYWVVGLDLFGDEMGYPYCPFVASDFLQYINERRSENRHFGLRIHCGENVLFADTDAGNYRHFIAHMYITFRSLRFLRRKLGTGIRIGHGIAFARILSDSMNSFTHRKSSVLLAEMREHAEYVLKNIVFEINITSNEYLLGQALREGCYHTVIRLDALTKKNIPIILSTDDDGIWPIDHCPSMHPGHHSLIAEYCRALSLKIITTPKQLQTMISNTNKYCFYSLEGVFIPPQHRENDWKLPKDDITGSTIIFHPDLIKIIMARYHFYGTNLQWSSKFYNKYREFYHTRESRRLSNPKLTWYNRCQFFAQIAYVALSTDIARTSLEDIEVEFGVLFPNSKNLGIIYNALNAVRNQFMSSNDMDNHHYIISDTNHVFLSESSSGEQQILRSTVQFLGKYSDQYHLNVFSSRVSALHESEQFRAALQSRSTAENISAAVYTTKSKDDYINPTDFRRNKLTLGARIESHTDSNQSDPTTNTTVNFTFNEKSSDRINSAGRKEEHMLYVICQHSSAATAYLHHIGNRLVKEYELPRTIENKKCEQVTDDEKSGIQPNLK